MCACCSVKYKETKHENKRLKKPKKLNSYKQNPIYLNTATKITALCRGNLKDNFPFERQKHQKNNKLQKSQDDNFQIHAPHKSKQLWEPLLHWAFQWIYQKLECSTGRLRWADLLGGAPTHWEPLIVPTSNYAHSWATLIICSMCLNNSLAFFTWQTGSRWPMGGGSTRSLLTAVDSPGQERCSAVHVWPCSAGLSCCCQQTMTPWHIDQT